MRRLLEYITRCLADANSSVQNHALLLIEALITNDLLKEQKIDPTLVTCIDDLSVHSSDAIQINVYIVLRLLVENRVLCDRSHIDKLRSVGDGIRAGFRIIGCVTPVIPLQNHILEFLISLIDRSLVSSNVIIDQNQFLIKNVILTLVNDSSEEQVQTQVFRQFLFKVQFLSKIEADTTVKRHYEAIILDCYNTTLPGMGIENTFSALLRWMYQGLIDASLMKEFRLIKNVVRQATDLPWDESLTWNFFCDLVERWLIDLEQVSEWKLIDAAARHFSKDEGEEYPKGSIEFLIHCVKRDWITLEQVKKYQLIPNCIRYLNTEMSQIVCLLLKVLIKKDLIQVDQVKEFRLIEEIISEFCTRCDDLENWCFDGDDIFFEICAKFMKKKWMNQNHITQLIEKIIEVYPSSRGKILGEVSSFLKVLIEKNLISQEEKIESLVDTIMTHSFSEEHISVYFEWFSLIEWLLQMLGITYFELDGEVTIRKALIYHEKSFMIYLRFCDKYRDLADHLRNIGRCYPYLGDFDKALEYFKQVYDIYLKILCEHHEDVIIVKEWIEAIQPGFFQKLIIGSERRWVIQSRGEVSNDLIMLKQKIQKDVLSKVVACVDTNGWSSLNLMGVDWGVKGYLERNHFIGGLEEDLDNTIENIEIVRMLCFESMNLGIMKSEKKPYEVVEEFTKANLELVKKIAVEHPEFFVDGSIVEACIRVIPDQESKEYIFNRVKYMEMDERRKLGLIAI